MIIGGIEAGGTKFVCGIGNEKGEILESIKFDTTTPEETMNQCIAYFKDKKIDAIGLGCFGPIQLNKEKDHYGMITTTPKLKWAHYDIVGTLKKHFNVPIGFDTDVNGACLGEAKFGAAKGLNNVVYMTIGTGIGAGALVEGKLVHGMLHPEMGHMRVQKHPKDAHFTGVCPYHHDCLEGLASGPSIEKRYGVKGQALNEKEAVWDLEAYYIAQAITNLMMILSPEKVILGGGVSKQETLMKYLRTHLKSMINGYIKSPELDSMEEYIVNPLLGDHAGLVGAIALGLSEINNGEEVI